MSTPYWPCEACNINLFHEDIEYTCFDGSHTKGVSLCEKHAKEQNETCILCGKPLKKKVRKNIY